MNCEICNRKFESIKALQTHVSHGHKINSKVYYDKCLKKNNEGICYCGNKTNYKNMNFGYHEYCSRKCQGKSVKVIEKRILKTSGENHWTFRVGHGPNKGKTYEEIHGEKKAKQLKENLSKWFLLNCVGENNPFYGKTHTQENKNIFRSNKLGKTYEELYGFERAIEIKKKIMKPYIEGGGDWRNYWSEYPLNFQDSKLRFNILMDQYFCCAICFKNISKKLSKNLHHINYIKKDNRRRNLIYLCIGCHSTTNTNRYFWKGYLRGLNREIIRSKKLSRKISYRIEKDLNLEFKQIFISRRIK